MKLKCFKLIKKLFAYNVTQGDDANLERHDLQEEYANAFRTESYNDFWTHVLALNKGDLMARRSLGSSTAAHLPSYRLFVEYLLEPDQLTITRILASSQIRPEILILLRDYFSNTSDASYLCGVLLKDIDRTRKKYKFLKDPNESSPKTVHLSALLARVAQFSRSNPFSQMGPSATRFRALRTTCSSLLSQLESSRDKTQAKICRLKRLRCGSTTLLMALATSLVVVVATHALVALAATSIVTVTCLKLNSMEKLVMQSTQLDAAAKGTYILIRDLDTVSRLVARLNDELENLDGLVRLWVKTTDDRLRASREVANWLRKSDERLIEQLDEVEEHLYLCFMTINRARNLVLKEILNSPK